jgi:hypothetical protein
MKRIKTFAQLFESVNSNNPEVARMKIYFNYPDDLDLSDEEMEEMGEDPGMVSGLYGDLLISLRNPEEVFCLDGEVEAQEVERYFNDSTLTGLSVAEAMRIEFGNGPYTIDNLNSHEVKLNLDDHYSIETRSSEAYLETETEGTPITSDQFSYLLSMRKELGDAVLDSIFESIIDGKLQNKWSSYPDEVKIAIYTPDLTFLSPDDHKMLSAAQSVQKKSGLY